MDLLSKHGKVRTKNLAAANRKLQKLINDGPGKLQVISDFDSTISRSRLEDGRPNWTTHSLFSLPGGLLSGELAEKLLKLHERYRPIEFNHDLSVEQKIPYMEKWWNEGHQIIVDGKLTKKQMETFVENSGLTLRDGTVYFGCALERFAIPLCVFSAGIGDIIEIIFRQTFGHVPSNLHVISNFMEYDRSGTVCSFKPPLLHSFNKCSAAIAADSKFFSDLQHRPNVILLGDMLGDLQMDRGLANEECILRIGFLNEQVEKSLSDFIDGYDVVVVDDQTFDVPNIVLNALLGIQFRDGFRFNHSSA